MNTKTTTILRTLLGSKALWVGVALVTTRVVMELLDQNRVVSGIALLVGIPLIVVGISIGWWRVMKHLADHHGWRWVDARESGSDNMLDAMVGAPGAESPAFNSYWYLHPSNRRHED